MQLEPVVRMVTRKTIDAYEEILGIGNPLHFDEEYARKTAFGGIIAHGMMSLAYISEMMGRAFGKGWYEGGELYTTFILPVRPGDIVSTQGRIIDQKQGDGEDYSVYEACCENQRGERILTGTAVARVLKLSL